MSQTLTDPVLSRLEAELEPWPRLLVIADRLEELGEDRLAWGYRWLAEHRKWPVLDKGLWRWPGYGGGTWGGSWRGGAGAAPACWAGIGTNSILCPTPCGPRQRPWP
jgi:hypothetical protein